MAIGVSGQFYLNFKVGNNNDFLEKDNLESFTVYEKVGNSIPTFSWVFRTRDDSITKKINEGNLLQAQIGKDVNSAIDISLSPSIVRPLKEGADFSRFEISGYTSSVDYITDHKLNITKPMSAIEAIIQVARNNGFVIKSNVEKSLDIQKWIQPNITDKAFVSDTYLRSVLPQNSFPSVAITADGQFIVKDILKDIDRTDDNLYDWKFTKSPEKSKDISYDPDAVAESQSGFINNWIGYGRRVYEIDGRKSGTQSFITNPDVVFSLSNQLASKPNNADRYGGVRFKNDNTHEKFWEAYNSNLVNLANLSKISNVLSFSDDFKLVRPLDIAMFSQEGNNILAESSEYISGLYIVTSVTRTYQQNRITTVITLNREALNEERNEA